MQDEFRKIKTNYDLPLAMTAVDILTSLNLLHSNKADLNRRERDLLTSESGDFFKNTAFFRQSSDPESVTIVTTLEEGDRVEVIRRRISKECLQDFILSNSVEDTQLGFKWILKDLDFTIYNLVKSNCATIPISTFMHYFRRILHTAPETSDSIIKEFNSLNVQDVLLVGSFAVENHSNSKSFKIQDGNEFQKELTNNYVVVPPYPMTSVEILSVLGVLHSASADVDGHVMDMVTMFDTKDRAFLRHSSVPGHVTIVAAVKDGDDVVHICHKRIRDTDIRDFILKDSLEGPRICYKFKDREIVISDLVRLDFSKISVSTFKHYFRRIRQGAPETITSVIQEFSDQMNRYK